jgi:hypothetical protein
VAAALIAALPAPAPPRIVRPRPSSPAAAAGAAAAAAAAFPPLPPCVVNGSASAFVLAAAAAARAAAGAPGGLLRAECASETTLVTSWFPLGASSKHAEGEYIEWMRRFLGRTPTPVVVFTTPGARAEVEAARGEGLPLRVVEREDVWALPWVAPRVEEYVGRQARLDPDAALHSPALYAVWNAKSALALEAIELDAFRSEFYLWVDAGSFREGEPFSVWPDPSRVRRLFGARPCRMLFQMAAPLQPAVNGSAPVYGLVVAGTFFGGARAAWRWWAEAYREAHDAWAASGLFVGNDQCVLNALVHRNLRRVMLLDTRDLPDACGSFMWTPYFFFQRYLALPSERRIGLDEPFPCPERKVILPEPGGDAGMLERGCAAEPWEGTAPGGPPWPPGVPDHAIYGYRG